MCFIAVQRGGTKKGQQGTGMRLKRFGLQIDEVAVDGG